MVLTRFSSRRLSIRSTKVGAKMNNNKQQMPVARRTGIVVRKLENEVLIYDTENHQAHCLNENAALIWEHCDGKRTVNELSDLLQNRLDAPVTKERRENLVLLALSQLEE